MQHTVIIDYGSGNLRSVARAFQHVAAASGNRISVSDDIAQVKQATHIVLPGVGAFADCMAGLQAIPGMIAVLEAMVLERKTPFLGICVGMQLLAKEGHEHGVTKGLGWLDAVVEPLTPAPGLKIPHMGWNELAIRDRRPPIMQGLSDGDHAYFVHSYHMRCTDAGEVLAVCDYGGEVAAIVGRGNIVGTQFHPEKSQATGLRVIENFLGIQG
ncbi:MAG: imidazole glycerol phosphate synthase subunit HisH [Alphaproteobacteria bacterium]|nr:imidazole glycerol phosphate synthase subunit HisH [Alphaproteobacteria bacterium]